MGGAITVESVVGEGSNFYFILPVDVELEPEGGKEDMLPVSDPALASEQTSIPEEGQSAAEFGPLRILVAEDHPVNQKLLVTMLDKEAMPPIWSIMAKLRCRQCSVSGMIWYSWMFKCRG